MKSFLSQVKIVGRTLPRFAVRRICERPKFLLRSEWFVPEEGGIRKLRCLSTPCRSSTGFRRRPKPSPWSLRKRCRADRECSRPRSPCRERLSEQRWPDRGKNVIFKLRNRTWKKEKSTCLNLVKIKRMMVYKKLPLWSGWRAGRSCLAVSQWIPMAEGSAVRRSGSSWRTWYCPCGPG